MTQIQIPGYKIEKEIGHGGMATVYKAVQESLDRPVALKVMAPALAADPSFGERFLKEARTVARLTHPNILAIHDIGSSGHHHYIAMEYVAGGDLKGKIKQGMTTEQALSVLQQTAAALDHAHRQGFVHRDIKPENILFRENGTLVLTDFGIAKTMGSGIQMTRTGMSIGTPHYMSPEQARGRQVDGRSDLYSLGVVFYEMLTGKVPYEAEDTIAVAYAHVNDPVPELPKTLSLYQVLIDHLMAKNPGDRFFDATQLLCAIEKVQAGQRIVRPASATQVAAAQAPVAETQAAGINRNSRYSGLLWGLGGAFIALVVAAVLYFANQPHKEMISSGGGSPSVAVSIYSSKPITTALKSQTRSAGSSGPENMGPNPAKLAKQTEIKRLLAKAEEDLAAMRLTSPAGNNAYEKYRAVLDLDSANNQAKGGLARIVNSYIEQSDTAINKADFARAEGYLSRAAEVMPDAAVIASTHKRLEVSKRTAFEKNINAGRNALENRNFEKAKTYFMAALSIYPKDISAKSGLAKAKALSSLSNPIKLGVAGAHSGDLASYGIPTVRAAELIVKKCNAMGGICGRQVELLVEDDVCKPEVATNTATKLVTDGANVVVGHICSGATKAAMGIYKESGIIAMSPSATNPALTQSGDYPNFYRTIASDDAQARLEVDFALDVLKLKKIAVLHDKGDYGKGLAEFAKGFLEADSRAEVVLYEGITPGAVDYSAVVQKIKQSEAEAVIFGGYHPEASKLVQQMRNKAMDTVFISDDGVKDDTFIKVAGEFAEGVYATGPVDISRNPIAVEAVELHKKEYGEEPGPFFLNAYAAALVLLQAIELAGSSDYKMVKKALTTQNFQTPLGVIGFDRKGDVEGAGFKLYQVQNRRFEVVY